MPDMPEDDTKSQPAKRGPGRPRKTDIADVSKGGRKKVGRPKGDAAIINEFKSRMLASPKSRAVLDSIFAAALDDDHKNQAAAWKLVMDRVLPTSHFEKDKKQPGISAVNITITPADVPNAGVSIEGEQVEDGDWEDID